MSEIPSEKSQKRVTPEGSAFKKTSSLARSSFFRYYIHDSIADCRLQLLGELTEADVPELAGCWRTAKTTLGSRQLILDLCGLKSADEAGKQWLAGMAQEGAKYLPETYLRDFVAGKHTAGSDEPKPPVKTGLLGRLLGLVRGLGIEAAK